MPLPYEGGGIIKQKIDEKELKNKTN